MCLIGLDSTLPYSTGVDIPHSPDTTRHSLKNHNKNHKISEMYFPHSGKHLFLVLVYSVWLVWYTPCSMYMVMDRSWFSTT